MCKRNPSLNTDVTTLQNHTIQTMTAPAKAKGLVRLPRPGASDNITPRQSCMTTNRHLGKCLKKSVGLSRRCYVIVQVQHTMTNCQSALVNYSLSQNQKVFQKQCTDDYVLAQTESTVWLQTSHWQKLVKWLRYDGRGAMVQWTAKIPLFPV